MLYPNYPNELERPLILSLIQMLWDRGEANGYAHHMTATRCRTRPPHKVLLHEAFGDHQVANVAAEVEARTIGARLRTPGAGSRAGTATAIPTTASRRSGATRSTARRSWSGTSARCARTARRDRRHAAAADHQHAARDGGGPAPAPRSDPSARIQKSEFLKLGGRVMDVCGPHPCYADGWTGP